MSAAIGAVPPHGDDAFGGIVDVDARRIVREVRAAVCVVEWRNLRDLAALGGKPHQFFHLRSWSGELVGLLDPLATRATHDDDTASRWLVVQIFVKSTLPRQPFWPRSRSRRRDAPDIAALLRPRDVGDPL